MTKKNKEILIKRAKSFGWRTGMMVLVAVLEFLLANEGVLDLPPVAVVVLGLAAGEFSKYLNSNR